MIKILQQIQKYRVRCRWFMCVFLMAFSSVASAQCLSETDLKGVNLAGAEFNGKKIPGKINKDYIYPNLDDLDYVVALGGNVIRLPFRWERIQPRLSEELDQAELIRLKGVVKAAKARHLCTILDIHNYGYFGKEIIGSESVPVSAFHDLWIRLAAQFTDPEATILGLMNEPSGLTIATWSPIAQSTVNAVRNDGAKNIILVSGGRWSGVHEWFKKSGTPAMSNAEAFGGLQDKLDRSWLEVHQYADANYSGMGKECISPDRFEKIFAPISAWAKKSEKKLFLGEFGVPADDNCIAALSEILKQISENESWKGSAYWAAGRWWGGYPYSIQMKGGVEPKQTGPLRNYFANKKN
jgi:endoglucanase